MRRVRRRNDYTLMPKLVVFDKADNTQLLKYLSTSAPVRGVSLLPASVPAQARPAKKHAGGREYTSLQLLGYQLHQTVRFQRKIGYRYRLFIT